MCSYTQTVQLKSNNVQSFIEKCAVNNVMVNRCITKIALTGSTFSAKNSPNIWRPDLLGSLKCSPNSLAVARRCGNKGIKERRRKEGKKERKGKLSTHRICHFKLGSYDRRSVLWLSDPDLSSSLCRMLSRGLFSRTSGFCEHLSNFSV